MTEPKTFADVLNGLFAWYAKNVDPDGKEPTPYAIAEWCRRNTGEKLTRTYISYLRNGDRDNPTINALRALAAFFEVRPAYFLDAEIRRQTHAELDLVIAVRDAQLITELDSIALSDDDRAKVEDVLRRLSK